ncbi:protein kinase [bacterium]|nr:protein kinase [candidate division CSSED10-310 bacterium]
MGQNLLKEANKLHQKGEYLDAGDLYKAAGKYEKALSMYMKVHAYNRSAPLLEWLGRTKEAARHYAKNGQYLKSAELFKSAKDYLEAGAMYRNAEIPLFAAEMFENASAYSEAALMYEQARDFVRAGDLYLERGMYGKAVFCFNKILENKMYVIKLDEGESSIEPQLQLKCGRAYEQLRKFDQAAECYFKAGAVQEAVRVCRAGGDLAKAAHYLESSRMWQEASEIYSEIGKAEKSRQLQIRSLMNLDKFLEAAELADDSGEFRVAAEAYEYAKEYAKAGEMFRLIGKMDKAAEMYLLAGKVLEAAVLYEQTGDLRQAAELREQLHEYDKAAELYALTGEAAKSGKLYLESGQLDDAIRVLQNAWSQDQKDPQVRNMLGLAFLRRGNVEIAFDSYLKQMIDEPVTADNIELFYAAGIGLDEHHMPEQALKFFERLSAYDLHYQDVKSKTAELTSIVRNLKSSKSTTTVPHQFTPGKVVADRYVIKGKVGSGGMGVVYRAKDRELDIEVALKVLKPKYSNDPEMIQRFKQEVTLARQILHENVIRLFDFDKIHNLLYISMEFFPNFNLKSIMKSQKPMPVDDIIRIITQVCHGLWAAHRRGIVHRDIKPQNILINDEGIVKLVDFGIATVIGPASWSEVEFVVGTPEYMSPEQARGEPTDTRSDIYSLGAILYEMACGVPPFSNPDSFQVLIDQVESEPVPPFERNVDLPRWLNDLILKCLEKDPDRRYDSVQFIERQLATCGLAELMLQAGDEDDTLF